MEKSFGYLVGFVVIFGLLFLLAEYNQERVEKKMATEITTRGDLQQNVEAFMRGEPVAATMFPWYNPDTNGVRTTSLEVALDLGEITKEEFEAFCRLELQWKRVN